MKYNFLGNGNFLYIYESDILINWIFKPHYIRLPYFILHYIILYYVTLRYITFRYITFRNFTNLQNLLLNIFLHVRSIHVHFVKLSLASGFSSFSSFRLHFDLSLRFTSPSFTHPHNDVFATSSLPIQRRYIFPQYARISPGIWNLQRI